ncbi:phospholipase D-like domain-containing protein [Alicyclobacillus tolerans]|uniref:phospholipase D n=1 Tax=Alicyclobacillus tolerans TaxID=90970 RepID=A0A1M6L7V2_9BACL|nr:phosphatidylserine/phosphatidylglycerophosphate/cardiolipin synthase family protein [Alicyclobacillus montanus]SHJ67244.1 Phosphatidylserine/phosphatidylglycerophosphate/cardiolipin synthase [Alicyclobacillus montanus]
MGPFKFRRIVQTTLCMFFTLFLVACGTETHRYEEFSIPPVTEKHLTLLWKTDIRNVALQMIDHAQHISYLDIYELSDPEILQALAEAKRRGVDVRVVIDSTEKSSQQMALPYLENNNVPVKSLHISGGISHVKMLLCDGEALLGGMNFGQTSWTNNDASVYFPYASQSFLSLFLFDWQRAGGYPAQAPVTDSLLIYDRSIEPAMLEALSSAHQIVQIEAFDLSSREIIRALESDLSRGVQVEILLDPNERYSRRAASQLRQAGATVRYYRPYQGELMHAKILDIDDGKIIFIGSCNFSYQAFNKNHEVDVLLEDMPKFSASIQENLLHQMVRGSDSPQPDHIF